MRIVLAACASLTLAAAARAEGGETGPHATRSSSPAGAPALAAPTTPRDVPEPARLPGYAASLANQPLVQDASGWRALSTAKAWHDIANSTPQTRQQTRWQYARSLIGRERWAEAQGVLETMAADDQDLALVPAFRVALGAAQLGLNRPGDALASLSAELLANNPEACAWRIRAMQANGLDAEALSQWSCARSALVSRSGPQRAPFLLAAARSALAVEHPEKALDLLESVPDADPAANLLRGKALLALGKAQDGQLRLERARENGTVEQRTDAEVSLIEATVAEGKAKSRRAYNQLDQLSYVWRGDAIERRALSLQLQLAESMHDDRAALRSGAILFRYHPPAGDMTELLANLQQRMGAILSPDSKVPLPEAAGLFWEYRDLSPSGAGGDLMVSQLAERLQSARLYERAAELLDYQLMARVKDISQGPLSVRVAKLYILASRPEDALKAISTTSGPLYSDEMLWARHSIEAIALHQLGRTDEALAVLEDVPDAAAIRQEIEWNRRNWQALADADSPVKAGSRRLSEVEQAVILRRAVALAMLGREAALGEMRARYSTAFAKLPTGPAFDLLTGPVGSLDSASVTRAMAAIPAVSPAGDIADLLAVPRQET